MNAQIYLDHNATTPVDQDVIDAMLPYLVEEFGNPSSHHAYGAAAKKAVIGARAKIASLLGCGEDEIVFTSGGSESNNFAIKGAALANIGRGNHLITTAVEHPSVLETFRWLERNGFTLSVLPVDEDGMVDPADVERAIRPETILISVMHANNEVGTIQPVEEIAAIAHRRGILVHTDCAQSVGKIPVSTRALHADLLTIAGHKMYAPKGIGALYIRSGVPMHKLIHGADHEMNFRAGTENVPYIVALGEACRLVCDHLTEYARTMAAAREHFEARMKQACPSVRVNGHPERRLPNTSSIAFKGIDAGLILAALNDVAASAGAACHSGAVDVSHVLSAMHVPLEYAMGTLRISTGRRTTMEEMEKAVASLKAAVDALQQAAPAEAEVRDPDDVRLTRYTSGLGCACKMRPQLLEEVLRSMPVTIDANVLADMRASDDAAVYRLSEKSAIVGTVDFFTPIVDDPFDFGAIAAANSLSDIYAMGARPVFALSIAAFPSRRLGVGVLKRIVEGACSVAAEAGIAIIGGHTIDDAEPKFGLAVTGIVEPGMAVTNGGMKPGDAIVLTKPIGTGILSTALKNGVLDQEEQRMLVRCMMRLNRDACEAMQAVGVHACTDVTGFGLLGHLLEMVRASGCGAEIDLASIPMLPRVRALAAAGEVPGGSRNNMHYTAPFVDYDRGISGTERSILNDAQTSGGLLIAVAGEKTDALMEALKGRGVDDAAVIGHAACEGGRIRIISVTAG